MRWSCRRAISRGLVPANRVTARDVMDCATVIASQAALTRLQEALA